MDFSKIDFSKLKKTEVKSKSNSNKISTKNTKVAIYLDGYFKVDIDGVLYEIYIANHNICLVDYIYSKPENDKWDDWSIKESSKNTTRLDLTNKWWSIIKDKQRVKGKLVGDYFVLDLEYVNHVNKLNYEKYLKSKNKNAKSCK